MSFKHLTMMMKKDPGPHFHILGQWNENWEPTSKGWNPSLVFLSLKKWRQVNYSNGLAFLERAGTMYLYGLLFRPGNAAWSCDELPQRLHLRPYIPLPITRCRNRPDDHPAAYRNFTQFWNRGLATEFCLDTFKATSTWCLFPASFWDAWNVLSYLITRPYNHLMVKSYFNN